MVVNRCMSMNLGIHTALASFQSAVSTFLSVVGWKVGLVYLDDLILFSPNTQSQCVHMNKSPSFFQSITGLATVL